MWELREEYGTSTGVVVIVQQCLTCGWQVHRLSGLSIRHEATMEVMLRKYGNRTVAVLPPAVLKDLGLSAGQAMSLGTTERGDIILSPKRKYRLADMIAQCNANAAPPADLALWETAKPAGQEVW